MKKKLLVVFSTSIPVFLLGLLAEPFFFDIYNSILFNLSKLSLVLFLLSLFFLAGSEFVITRFISRKINQLIENELVSFFNKYVVILMGYEIIVFYVVWFFAYTIIRALFTVIIIFTSWLEILGLLVCYVIKKIMNFSVYSASSINASVKSQLNILSSKSHALVIWDRPAVTAQSNKTITKSTHGGN